MKLYNCAAYHLTENKKDIYRAQNLCNYRNCDDCVFKRDDKSIIKHQYILDKVYEINEL